MTLVFGVLLPQILRVEGLRRLRRGTTFLKINPQAMHLAVYATSIGKAALAKGSLHVVSSIRVPQLRMSALQRQL